MDDFVVIGLYRHGVTADNEKRAFSGWTDSALSEAGKRGLEQLKLDLPSYEKVIASDLQRCIDTAAIFFQITGLMSGPNFAS